MLSKDDVDRMVRDATEHAEEDRQRREQVETRNQAEALTFQAERTLRDLGDKVSSEDKAQAEEKIAEVRSALTGNDAEAVRARSSELQEILARIATAAYQASATDAGGAAADGTGATDGTGESAGGRRARGRGDGRGRVQGGLGRGEPRTPAPHPAGRSAGGGRPAHPSPQPQ